MHISAGTLVQYAPIGVHEIALGTGDAAYGGITSLCTLLSENGAYITRCCVDSLDYITWAPDVEPR